MSDWNMYDTLSEVKINNNTKVILLGNVTMWFIGLQFHFISPPQKKKKRNTAPWVTIMPPTNLGALSSWVKPEIRAAGKNQFSATLREESIRCHVAGRSIAVPRKEPIHCHVEGRIKSMQRCGKNRSVWRCGKNQFTATLREESFRCHVAGRINLPLRCGGKSIQRQVVGRINSVPRCGKNHVTIRCHVAGRINSALFSKTAISSLTLFRKSPCPKILGHVGIKFVYTNCLCVGT